MNTLRTFKLHGQRGVGLVEVLVAVLVLSIGLLGIAGLQLRTIRNNQSALERGIAVIETHALADALRADRQKAKAGLFNLTLAAAAPTGTTFREVVLARWRANILNALGPDATGEVNCNGTLCTIIVQWNDSRGAGGSATQQVQTEVQI
jgi:type IV pilus assembly protein PilV